MMKSFAIALMLCAISCPSLVAAPGPGGSGGSGGGSGNRYDLSGDGRVGMPDLMILLSAWGSHPGGHPADFNGDGRVNAADRDLLTANWG